LQRLPPGLRNRKGNLPFNGHDAPRHKSVMNTTSRLKAKQSVTKAGKETTAAATEILAEGLLEAGEARLWNRRPLPQRNRLEGGFD